VSTLSYSLQFRGHATPIEPGVLIARASAPSCAFVTTIDGDGVHGTVEPREGGEALLELRLSLLDERAFEEHGTVSFRNGDALRFRSLAPGLLTRCPDPNVRHGTAICEIDGGSGRFTGASGRIASSFLVSDTGELTEHQLALLFLEPREVFDDA
jgi:hypothetical protein